MGACLGRWPRLRPVLPQAARACLGDDATQDAFAADYSRLSRLWEALSPEPVLENYRDDYRWLTQLYHHTRPASGEGGALWHDLGPKTRELIHEHIHVERVRDDLEELVMDADLLEALKESAEPRATAREIEIKVTARLGRHQGDPRFEALSDRLDRLKRRHEAGQLESILFLQQLLELARDFVQAERETSSVSPEDRGKAALTELFQEVRTDATPAWVERVVDDIDEIVRNERFSGWQSTSRGQRDMKKALRTTLFDHKIHSRDLFDKAYAYIAQYY